MSKVAGKVTQILGDLAQGQGEALGELWEEVYEELHKIARAQMARERSGHTLQATALMNEAFLKLSKDAIIVCKDRKQFYGIAANVMRRVLVDHARKRNAAKRGAAQTPVTFREEIYQVSVSDSDVLAIDEVLERLAAIDERKAKIVELRYFAGLTLEEVAETLGCSAQTVKREWANAKTWLQHALESLGHCEEPKATKQSR
jgi:RNA polymerase sigma factor (TIGR02999 family)